MTTNKTIYVKECEGIPITSLTILIDSLYRQAKEPCPTSSYARWTYQDAEFKHVDCFVYRRSFEDLLCLARTYFPETTEVDLMKVLKELKMGFNYCGDIHKVVFYRIGSYKLISNGFLMLNNNNFFTAGTYTPPRLAEIYNQTNEE